MKPTTKIFIALCSFLSLAVPAAARELPVNLIKLPPGFTIEVYAEDVPNARSMTLSPRGTLYVGTRTAGNVYALRDEDGDNKAEKIFTVARGLRMPNGVAFKDGSLYVAEVGRILRFNNIEENLENPPDPVVVSDAFPSDEWHGWKFIRFGPQDKLYIPVGAPCNVCDRPENPMYSSIMRMNKDGTDLEVFAHGVRNSVGFDWNPLTGDFWFTDNGRDMLGDDFPPDELNRAPQAGMHFGFPYCHGKGVPDPEYNKGKNCAEFTPAALELAPHTAALGMRFYSGGMFPEQYQSEIFIAEHGSWNRSRKIGYRIMLVRLEANTAAGYEVFAEGWKQGEDAWGRPVDVEVMPDGALLVSDDHAGAIYRISYKALTE